MTRKRTRIARLSIAAILALSTVLGTLATSSATPSKQDVADAKAHLSELNRTLDGLIEQYNQARLKLEQARTARDAALKDMRAAQAVETQARADLSARAVQAYTGMGSQLDVILGSSSFTEFSDRLEFLGAVAQSDADLAAKAQNASQQAQWASQRYAASVQTFDQQQTQLQQKVGSIRQAVQQQTALYQTLSKDYQAALAAERAAEATAAAAANGGTGGSGGSGGFVPPPNASQAQIAIAAAESAIGTPYVWGAASPSVGFDCSGLAMWSYAQAGVSLPHSSLAQYNMLPHISRTQLQPGDLLFFYRPVSHVAIYVGGDQEIDASHPGTTVSQHAVYWDGFVAGGRPT
jgi:cell wall-associated NlpC family hydrolase